jgi:hypothetical protein
MCIYLTCSVPHIELDGTPSGVKLQLAHFSANVGNVFSLEFTVKVSLEEGSLASCTVSNKEDFKSGNFGGLKPISKKIE